jgi:hypothetical protein
MSFDTGLSIIGGLFLFLTIGAWLIDTGSSLFKRRKPLNVNNSIQTIGIAGAILWFCIAFGVVSWLVSVIYWFVIESVGKAV